MCIFDKMSFKVVIDDTILFSYGSIKAGNWFLFKISAVLIFSLHLLNMHMTSTDSKKDA